MRLSILSFSAAALVKREQFIADVTYVPSGVAEITRLQQKEGYAYLKP